MNAKVVPNRSFISSDDFQIVSSSTDPVCPVGYINFTKLHLETKAPSDFKDYVIKNSLDFINELNSSSYSDLSDPDLTDTELEFIEKENFAKQSGLSSIPGSFSRSQSLNMTKHNSVEHEPPEEMKFEYEQGPLNNVPHVVSNTKGWHWISSIQGECAKWSVNFVHYRKIFSRRGRNDKRWNHERAEPPRR